MEKFILYLMELLNLNSKEQHRNFYGIDELKLDSIFENLSCSKKFTKLSKNKFKADNFELSKGIGNVKNILIKTSYGKIYDVSFDCIESTNISVIDSIMADFVNYNIINNIENDLLPIKMTQLSDGNVMFTKNLVKKENRLSYRYCDIKKLLRNSN